MIQVGKSGCTQLFNEIAKIVVNLIKKLYREIKKALIPVDIF